MKADHPNHYGGKDDPYEAIKVIEAWQLGFCLGNTVKYICRAGRKPGENVLDDLQKARWYLDREISRYLTRRAEDFAGIREGGQIILGACDSCTAKNVEINSEGWCRKCFAGFVNERGDKA